MHIIFFSDLKLKQKVNLPFCELSLSFFLVGVGLSVTETIEIVALLVFGVVDFEAFIFANDDSMESV